MKTRNFLMIAGALMLSFTSCQKDSGLIDDTSIDHADFEAIADAVFEDVFNTADNATIILDQMMKGIDSKSETVVDTCPLVTVTRPTAALWPRIVTVDYGTGCAGFNDNTRSGKIVIEVTGPRLETGSMRTVTFVDYYFNEMKIEGTKVFENKGLNANQNLVVSATLTGGKVILPDGKSIERSINHQREWTAGLNTRYIWDDECLITGTAGGKNRNGVQYTNTIMTPLHWKRACRFIVSGIVKLEIAGQDLPMEMNYGTGECDAKAIVTRGGESREILLRTKVR